MENKIKSVDYDRDKLTSGILHIGVGNFHRAHEEYYTNELIEKFPSQSHWGITGAMLLPSDECLYEALKSQDGLYTLTVCGRDGRNEVVEIGSLREVLWSGSDLNEIIEKIADPSIRIISLTITEGDIT